MKFFDFATSSSEEWNIRYYVREIKLLQRLEDDRWLHLILFVHSSYSVAERTRHISRSHSLVVDGHVKK